MKEKLKGLVIGILIGTIMTATIANAATLYDVINQGIKIVVDGKKLNPTDANGKTVEPIIYNGTTYLPVRAIASALGKEVYWDGPNYTVYLGEMGGRLEYPTVELENMSSITGAVQPTNKLTDNYENRYSRAVIADKMEFLTNMRYSRFKATLYVEKGATTPASKWIKIVADGKTIYTSPEMTKSSAPVNIDVNIKGYNDIKIEVERKQGFLDGNLMLHFADGGFYQ